jgi:hypothetical protein
MVDTNSLNYIIYVAKGGEIKRLDRAYIQYQCAWRAEMMKASKWLVDKQRKI